MTKFRFSAVWLKAAAAAAGSDGEFKRAMLRAAQKAEDDASDWAIRQRFDRARVGRVGLDIRDNILAAAKSLGVDPTNAFVDDALSDALERLPERLVVMAHAYSRPIADQGRARDTLPEVVVDIRRLRRGVAELRSAEVLACADLCGHTANALYCLPAFVNLSTINEVVEAGYHFLSRIGESEASLASRLRLDHNRVVRNVKAWADWRGGGGLNFQDFQIGMGAYAEAAYEAIRVGERAPVVDAVMTCAEYAALADERRHAEYWADMLLGAVETDVATDRLALLRTQATVAFRKGQTRRAGSLLVEAQAAADQAYEAGATVRIAPTLLLLDVAPKLVARHTRDEALDVLAVTPMSHVPGVSLGVLRQRFKDEIARRAPGSGRADHHPPSALRLPRRSVANPAERGGRIP